MPQPTLARPVLVCAVVVCATACASHPVEHAPPPHLRRETASDTAIAPLRSPPRYEAGRGAYEITSVTIITRDVDGTARTDTLTTQAIVHDDARWTTNGLEVTGTVVSHVIRGSEGIESMAPVIPDPVPFTARVDTATSRVDFISDSVAASARGCPAPNTEALAAARDLLTAIPRSLSPGTVWTDSLVTTACRGALPVRSSAVRHFAVTLERASATPEGVVIVVSHTTEARFAGTGQHDAQSVTLEGTRHAVSRQSYDALIGALLVGHVQSDLDLRVGPPGDMHHVHQHAETTVQPIAG
jgi:hypothetical protein